MDIQQVKPIELRHALGQFATGVTVVTTLTSDKQHVGMTANSFNSVSMTPPLVLWSIGKNSANYREFFESEYFAIHILGADQDSLSKQFAQRDGDRFANLECRSGVNNLPLLPDFSACFQCSMEHRYDGGDHTIMVGRVIDFENRGLAPLIFHSGSYAELGNRKKR